MDEENNQQPRGRVSRSFIFSIIIVAGIIALIAYLIFSNTSTAKTMKLDDFVHETYDGNVTEVQLVSAETGEVEAMEIDNGFLFVVHRTVHCFRSAVEHDFQLIIIALDKLHHEGCLPYRPDNLLRLGSTNADGHFLSFHINCELHPIAPIANLFPHIL